MAWTAPSAGTEFAVNEVVTASKMNTKITDNLRYLKGLDGAIALSDRLSIPASTQTANAGYRHAGASSDVTAIEGYDSAGISALIVGVNRHFDGTAFAHLISGRAGSVLQITDNTLAYNTYPASSLTATTRLALDASGRLGVGQATPTGPLQVKGALGTWTMFEATLTSGAAQTVVPTGTVNYGLWWAAIVRDTTAGASGTAGATISATLATKNLYTSGSDIVDLVYASNGFSLQRTGGTHSYQVTLWIMTF